MRSFVDLDKTFAGQPRELGAVLARIDTGRGRERLFEDQAPELLGQLAEHARIASITASNAIEGITVDSDRAERIAEGGRRYRNRNEREFAGYRDATDTLMRLNSYEPLSVPFVLRLHRLLFAHTDGNGGNLKADQNLIVSYESGRREVVFTPPPPEETEFLLTELLVRYEEAKREARTHPLVLTGALVLDFLAIHPVADGNGRLARLLTTYELLSQGYKVARYVSIEQRIYESKNTYYASLYESQRDWHEGKHDAWPWIFYLARILADAYEDFAQRVVAAGESTGSKQDRVRDYILRQASEEFRRRDVERALPGISLATIRLVLNELRDARKIKPEGSGPGARWRRLR
jgi:Fic family protein